MHTDSSNAMAIIPFTGYAGSQLNPNLGISSKATSIVNVVLKFSFDPKLTRDVTALPSASGYISNCLVSAFRQLAAVPNGPNGSPIYPSFKNQSLNLSMSFVIVQQGDAGLGVKFVSPAPDLDSVEGKPALGISRQKTGTYKLDIEIPLIEPTPPTTKRIISGIAEGGRVYLIDRPFEEGLHQTLSPYIGTNGVNFQINSKGAANAISDPFGVEPEVRY
jgi:hypothetical protein